MTVESERPTPRLDEAEPEDRLREATFLTSDVCVLIGASYRQVSHLVSTSVVSPSIRGAGAGYPHRWTLEDAAMAAAVLWAREAVAVHGLNRSIESAIVSAVRRGDDAFVHDHGDVRLWIDLDAIRRGVRLLSRELDTE